MIYGLGFADGSVILNNGIEELEIRAHDSEIAVLKICKKGDHFVTCSKKGTLFRVFSIIDGKLIQIFRRGIKKTLITNILFDDNCKYLCSFGESSTMHFFKIEGNSIDEVRNVGNVKLEKNFSLKSILIKNQGESTIEMNVCQLNEKEEISCDKFLYQIEDKKFIKSKIEEKT